MLGSVPPIKQTANSFYCGEPYSGNTYYYFEKEQDGFIYGQLKSIRWKYIQFIKQTCGTATQAEI